MAISVHHNFVFCLLCSHMTNRVELSPIIKRGRLSIVPTSLTLSYRRVQSVSVVRSSGQWGVPWVQIMENEFECLADRRGLGGYSNE